MEYNQKLKLLIDGKWTDSSQRDTLPVIDPATEKILSHLPIADENDMERALFSSKKGFQIWSKWTPLRRQAVMLKTVEIIRKRSDDIAKTLTMEMGKTLRESKQEINQVIETNKQKKTTAKARATMRDTGDAEALTQSVKGHSRIGLKNQNFDIEM